MPFYDRGCAVCPWTAVDVFEPVTPAETPICPACGEATSRIWISRTSRIIGDECDIWQENGFSQPRHFTHKSELRRALAEKGLEIRAANAGPDDKICRSWGTMDPYTMEMGRQIAERQAHTKASTPERDESHVDVNWTIRTVES